MVSGLRATGFLVPARVDRGRSGQGAAPGIGLVGPDAFLVPAGPHPARAARP